MNRRKLLGMLAGGAAAGPGMVKRAAEQTLADLAVSSGSNIPVAAMTPLDGGVPNDWARNELGKLVGRTAVQHAYYKRRTYVQALDPDIASMRSPSLGWRISQQRERTYWREYDDRRGMLDAALAGWLD